jgi:hypothetical protein
MCLRENVSKKGVLGDQSFGGLLPGDHVTVDWGRKKEVAEGYGYGKEGVVLQVTSRQVVIRHPLGYTFCVTLAHLLGGARIIPERKEVDRVEETARETAEGQPKANGPPAIEEIPAPDSEAPTPLEAIEQGIPLNRARVMARGDLTKEIAEKLLAAGVPKDEIIRLYGYKSKQGFYGSLKKWGLYKSTAKGQGATTSRKQGMHLKAAPAGGTEISLREALERLDKARGNLKSVKLLLRQASEKTLLSEDVIARLAALEEEYAAEAARIEAVLEEIRVVI